MVTKFMETTAVDMSWDEPLSDNLVKDWSQVFSLLTSIPSITIPRFVGNQKGGVCQLLVFCDASMSCYATTVYLRIVDGANIQTNLMFSKVRLVPTGKGKSKQGKELTIPHLKLLPVLIGTRAANFVTTELRMTILHKIIWTDSQCVLHGLKTTKPLSVFVENRL